MCLLYNFLHFFTLKIKAVLEERGFKPNYFGKIEATATKLIANSADV